MSEALDIISREIPPFVVVVVEDVFPANPDLAGILGNMDFEFEESCLLVL